jgi:heme o synthase
MTDLSATDLARASAQAEEPVARIGDYFALLKPRVMSLVVFTALVGLVLAPGHIHPLVAATAILAIALGAGASGAINMWYDRDIDAVMARTASRPIPAGRIDPEEALAFGTLLSIAAVALMALATNFVAASLLAFTILFYVFVYTMWLKRRTPQNIVIGGAAGAFPPMVAWAAVTGDVSWASASLVLPIFLWTPPHFWALALYRSGDYQRAGVPMLPVVAGEAETRRQMLLYTLLLVPATLLPCWLDVAGWLYGTVALLLGLAFIAAAIAVWRAPAGDHRTARRMFRVSLVYLAALFAALPLDRLLGP